MKDVSFGKYNAGNSVIHRLDPRTKTLWAVTLAVMSLLSDRPFCVVFNFCVALIFFHISGIRAKIRLILPAVYITILSLVSSCIAQKEFTLKSFYTSAFFLLRIVSSVVASDVLASTTKPTDIAFAAECGLRWTIYLGFNAHDICTCAGIAVHFIPILCDEAVRIREAQCARGFSTSGMNVLRKVKDAAIMIVPLFASALRKAERLADSMDSRLYGTCKRGSLHIRKYGKTDYVSYVLYIVYIVLWILLRLCNGIK